MQTIEETELFFGKKVKRKNVEDQRKDFIVLPELNDGSLHSH